MTAPRPLRVLSYNVRYFGHATRGLVSTGSAMRRIAEAIASLDPLPDIVCLQEVETRSFRSNVAHPTTERGETQLQRFMGMLGTALKERHRPDDYEAYYFPAHVYAVAKGANVYTTGLAVLAHRSFTLLHHNARAPHDITHRRLHALRGLKQTRICAHVRFARRGDPARSVDVFNTHFSLPSTMAKEFWTEPARMGFGKNQLEEARNLVRFVERERTSDRFLVVGDFNSLPGSPVYEHLLGTGWTDPFARLHSMTTAEMLGWPTAGFMRLRMHIDHVLSGPGLDWVDFDDCHAFGDRSSRFHGLSDHAPMVARFRSRA
jgi:endonuclease/exonuclease/phosphatase family metal-dependent hydrolase